MSGKVKVARVWCGSACVEVLWIDASARLAKRGMVNILARWVKMAMAEHPRQAVCGVKSLLLGRGEFIELAMIDPKDAKPGRISCALP